MYTFQNPKTTSKGLSETGKLVLVGFLSAFLGIVVTVVVFWLWKKRTSQNNYEVLASGSH